MNEKVTRKPMATAALREWMAEQHHRPTNISEKERLLNRAHSVIRRDRIDQQRLQTQAFNQEQN